MKRTPNSSFVQQEQEENQELIVEYDRNQWRWSSLLLAATSAMLADLNYTLLISFFPEAAKKKGLSLFTVGLVISVFQLFNFLTCFIAPAVTSKLGARLVLILANMLQSGLSVGMAFTGMINDPKGFFVSVIILRSLQGVAASFAEIAAGGIGMRSVPYDKLGEAMTYIEMTRVLGTVSGPLLGGIFFNIGGYPSPFILSAALLCIMAIALILTPMAKEVDNKGEGRDVGTGGPSATRILWSQPVIVILFFLILSFCVAFTFIEPTLQPFLIRPPFNLGHASVGGVAVLITLSFLVFGAITPFFINFIGLLPSMSLGFLLMGISFIIMAPPVKFEGPLSLFSFMHQTSFSGSMALICSGMLLLGMAGGLVYNPVNNLMVSEADFAGLSLEECSDQIVSILNQAFTLGGFFGPLISGCLVHHLGFPRSCTLFGYITLFFTALAITLLFVIFKRRKPETDSTDSDLTTPFVDDRIDSQSEGVL